MSHFHKIVKMDFEKIIRDAITELLKKLKDKRARKLKLNTIDAPDYMDELRPFGNPILGDLIEKIEKSRRNKDSRIVKLETIDISDIKPKKYYSCVDEMIHNYGACVLWGYEPKTMEKYIIEKVKIQYEQLLEILNSDQAKLLDLTIKLSGFDIGLTMMNSLGLKIQRLLEEPLDEVYDEVIEKNPDFLKELRRSYDEFEKFSVDAFALCKFAKERIEPGEANWETGIFVFSPKN